MPASTPRNRPKPKAKGAPKTSAGTPRRGPQTRGRAKTPGKTGKGGSTARVAPRAGISVCRTVGDGYAILSAWEPFDGHSVSCQTVDDTGAKYGLVGTRPNTDRQAEANRALAAIVAEHPDATAGDRRTGYVRVTNAVC